MNSPKNYWSRKTILGGIQLVWLSCLTRCQTQTNIMVQYDFFNKSFSSRRLCFFKWRASENIGGIFMLQVVLMMIIIINNVPNILIWNSMWYINTMKKRTSRATISRKGSITKLITQFWETIRWCIYFCTQLSWYWVECGVLRRLRDWTKSRVRVANSCLILKLWVNSTLEVLDSLKVKRMRNGYGSVLFLREQLQYGEGKLVSQSW